MRKFVLLICVCLTLGLGVKAQVVRIRAIGPIKEALTIQRYKDHETVFDEKVFFKDDLASVTLNGEGLYWLNNIPIYINHNDHVELTMAVKDNALTRVLIDLKGRYKKENLLFYELDSQWQKYTVATIKDEFDPEKLIFRIDELELFIKSVTQNENLRELALYYNRLRVLGLMASAKKLDSSSLSGYISKMEPYSTKLGLMTDSYSSNFMGQYYLVKLRLDGLEGNKFEVMKLIAQNFKQGRLLDERIKFFVNNNLRFYGLTNDMKAILPLLEQKVTSSDVAASIANKLAIYERITSGKKSPNFVLQDVNGNVVKLSDFKGKVVAADLWATWCSVCIKKMPYYLKLRESYKNNPDVVFLTISIDNDFALPQWKSFLAKHNMKGQELIALGEGGEQFKKDFNISVVPKYLIINKEGEIVLSYGDFNENYIALLNKTVKENL